MNEAPPSKPSPPRDYGPEEPSYKRPLTEHEYRVRTEADEERRAEERAEDLAAAKLKKIRSWVAGVVSIVAGTVATLAFAQGQIDAGTEKKVAPLAKRVQSVEDAQVQMSSRLANVEHSSTRSEAMVEMLVRNRGLTPPPKDGGQ